MQTDLAALAVALDELCGVEPREGLREGIGSKPIRIGRGQIDEQRNRGFGHKSVLAERSERFQNPVILSGLLVPDFRQYRLKRFTDLLLVVGRNLPVLVERGDGSAPLQRIAQARKAELRVSPREAARS